MHNMPIQAPHLARDADRALERLKRSAANFADWFFANQAQLDDDGAVGAHVMMGVMNQFERSIPLVRQSNGDGNNSEQLQTLLVSANETCDDVVEFLSYQKKAVI